MSSNSRELEFCNTTWKTLRCRLNHPADLSIYKKGKSGSLTGAFAAIAFYISVGNVDYKPWHLTVTKASVDSKTNRV